MEIVTIYQGNDVCTRCQGWKRIDNGSEGISWKYWAELPAGSDIAVKLGIVKPIECPRCKGSGQEPGEFWFARKAREWKEAARALSKRYRREKERLEDMAAQFDDILNLLWGLLYPEDPEGWEYPGMVYRHIKVDIERFQEAKKVLAEIVAKSELEYDSATDLIIDLGDLARNALEKAGVHKGAFSITREDL